MDNFVPAGYLEDILPTLYDLYLLLLVDLFQQSCYSTRLTAFLAVQTPGF